MSLWTMTCSTRFEVQCYICGPGCTMPAPFEGVVTFSQMFNHRPLHCRFVVARPQLAGAAAWTAATWGVWDLLDDHLLVHGWDGQSLGLSPSRPCWTGENVDALIMKGVMSYATDRQP